MLSQLGAVGGVYFHGPITVGRNALEELKSNKRAAGGFGSATSIVGTRLVVWVATAVLTMVFCFAVVVIRGNEVGSLEWAIFMSALVFAATLVFAVLPSWLTKRTSLAREGMLLFVGLSLLHLLWDFLAWPIPSPVAEYLVDWLVLVAPVFLVYALIASGATALVELFIYRLGKRR